MMRSEGKKVRAAHTCRLPCPTRASTSRATASTTTTLHASSATLHPAHLGQPRLHLHARSPRRLDGRIHGCGRGTRRSEAMHPRGPMDGRRAGRTVGGGRATTLPALGIRPPAPARLPTISHPSKPCLPCSTCGVGDAVAMLVAGLHAAAPDGFVDLGARPNHNHQLHSQACNRAALGWCVRRAAKQVRSALQPGFQRQRRPGRRAGLPAACRRALGAMWAWTSTREARAPCRRATSSSKECRTSF